MFRNYFYYRLKPLIPRPIRFLVRRWFVQRKLKHVRDIWPVMPGSERPPEGWKGWPDGKKFALVLTHDVEGPEGLEKCRDLMRLEMEMGFRSSFNFVPEGSYRVSPELRTELTRNGFEVGIHDLRHDGRLFESHSRFQESAERINKYVHEWGAAGYRSGFMMRNLDWLHALDVEYDMSTFDTDPFEPQPEGERTIFPFWVPGGKPDRPYGGNGALNGTETPAGTNGRKPATSHNGHDGYVEMPYTLPQDSTLFLLLREETSDIWKKKLEWIAEHGGMALVNIHPDYIDFSGSGQTNAEYPVARAREFLDYVSKRFAGTFWQPLPRELAAWFAQNRPPASEEAAPSQSLRGQRVGVVVFSHYPSDPRPRREAETLAQLGMEVDVICLKKDDAEPSSETFNGVRITRLPLKRRREGKLSYLLQYGTFILGAFFLLAFRSVGRRYRLVHVHNMPDVLVFSALVPKILGAKVILDLHDPMPELMMTIFGISENSFAVRLMKRLEKISIWFADAAVTVNLACKKIFSSRSCRAEKVHVVMNSPDERIFKYRDFSSMAAKNRLAGKPFILMYHGSLVERHGLDLAVQAVGSLKESIPGIQLRVYGRSTPFLEQVMESVRRDGLQDQVTFLPERNLEQIVDAIDECDVGIIPNRRSIFTELNTPTRIFEYLSRGKPVIAPAAPGIQDYFPHDSLVFFNLGDATDLAKKIDYVFKNPVEVDAIVSRGQGVYSAHRWGAERAGFVDLVTRLVKGRVVGAVS